MTANPMRGQADCSLSDGRKLTLVVDFDALAIAEDVAGMGVNDILAGLAAKEPRMKVMRAVVFGALAEMHQDIGMKEVGALLLSDDATALADALGRAVEGAFQRETGGEPNPPPPPSHGAGTSSKKTGRRRD